MRAPLLDGIELPLVSVLADMEWDGMAIDLAWFASLKERFTAERQRVEQLIYASAGETFNINSNPQLRVILFEKLGLPVKKKTATGPSTDASVLAGAGRRRPRAAGAADGVSRDLQARRHVHRLIADAG